MKGIPDLTGAYVVFTAVKAAGYTVVASRLGKKYDKNLHPAFVGVTRAVLGLGGGALCEALFNPGSVLSFALLLIPIRLLEWWLVLLVFYDRSLRNWKRHLRISAVCTACSFVLDVPALALAIFVADSW